MPRVLVVSGRTDRPGLFQSEGDQMARINGNGSANRLNGTPGADLI